VSGEYAVFETRYGWVGVAASARGLVRSVLPRSTREAAERGLVISREQFGRLIPPPEDALRLLEAFFRGEVVDLSGCRLDLTGVGVFEAKVYAVVAGIGSGSVLTYGQTAALAGSPGAARAVGGAMRRNPLPPFIPCHRVVGGGGRLVGFSSEGGIGLKRRLLEMEGVVLRGERVVV
jgi:methylated-DNA-[protein]-cysteine S-methyltransferase